MVCMERRMSFLNVYEVKLAGCGMYDGEKGTGALMMTLRFLG